VDDVVHLADRAHRQPGIEGRARRDDTRPLRDVGGIRGQLLGDLSDGEHRSVGGPEVVGIEMVGVDVGDQDRGGTVDRLALGEHAGVEDEHLTVVLDPDAGVAELRDPHAPSVAPCHSPTVS